MKIITCIFICFSNFIYAQSKNKELIDSLRFVHDLPYICRDTAISQMSFGCGDHLFWRIVKQKQEIIPLLIDELDDSTPTEVPVPNSGGQYAIGDMAYTALEEIIRGIPTYELLGFVMDEDCGSCSYWNHISKKKNRRKFERNVRKWYKKNKANLIWFKSDEILTCDCTMKHPNGGHFELK